MFSLTRLYCKHFGLLHSMVISYKCYKRIIAVMVLWTGCVHSQDHHVVLDVDPGIDDAMAILTILGDPTVTVEAITCVRGNEDVQTVVVNLYKTLSVVNRLEIPVYIGIDFGLVSSPNTDHFFGKDGFGDLGDELNYDPKWATKVKQEHAAIFLARIVSERPGSITILAIGPLTNIALALELNPEFLKHARKVVILGGSIQGSGNVAPGVEFNFFQDPDAAAVVLDRAELSKVSVTLVPLETVANCDLGVEWRTNTLSSVKNEAMTFLNKLDAKQREMHPRIVDHYTPHDTYAAVALVNPSSIKKTQKVYGLVERAGQATKGVLLLDSLNLLNKYTNLEVIMEFDKDELRKTIFQDMSTFNK